MKSEIDLSLRNSRLLKEMIITFGLVLMLSGCSGSGNDDSPVVEEPEINKVAAQIADSDPGEPDASLQNSMDDVFGGADADPVDVLEGDTFATVSERASSL